MSGSPYPYEDFRIDLNSIYDILKRIALALEAIPSKTLALEAIRNKNSIYDILKRIALALEAIANKT